MQGHQETLARLRELLRDGKTEAFLEEVDGIISRCTTATAVAFWQMVRRWGSGRRTELLPESLYDANLERAIELDRLEPTGEQKLH